LVPRSVRVLAATVGVVALFLGTAWATPPDYEEWPLASFPEPSGVVYHPLRKTLFLAGDEGDLGELSLTGELLNMENVGGDLEGITCDPSTGLLYVVREGHEVIFEVRPEDLKIMRRFTVDRTFEGNPNFLQRGGDGIEGLTFKPDPTSAEGGRFYAVNQFDPPVLVELEVPIKTSKERFGEAKILSAKRVGSPPLSDVVWFPAINGFLVTSALWRSVYVTDAAGDRTQSVRIPGLMQEGIAALPDGSFVIVQDTGGLIKWNPPDNPFSTPEKEASAKKTDATETAHEAN